MGSDLEKERITTDVETAAQKQPLYVSALLRPLLSLRSRPVSSVLGETEPQKGSRRHISLSGILLTLIITAIMALPFLPGQVQIEPGMPAASDIFSPQYLRYESVVLLEKAREAALADPSNEVWTQDVEVLQRQRSQLFSTLATLDAVRGEETLGIEAQRGRLRNLRDAPLTDRQIDLLLNLSDSDYNYWRNSGVVLAFDATMKDRRISSEAEVQAARRSLPDRIVPALNDEQKAAVVALVSPLLTVNMRRDEEQTRQRREAAAANVKPVTQTVQKGEAILRQGELATPEAIEKMRQAGLLGRELSFAVVAGMGVLVGLLMLLMHIYIYRYAEPVWRRQKQLLLVALLIIVTVAAARVFLPGHAILPYMLPVAAVSMLIAVLLSSNLAVLVTFVLSVLLGIVASGNLSMELPVYYFVGGLTGIFTLTRVERVSTFARAGTLIAVASFLTSFTLRLLSGGVIDWNAFQVMGLTAVFNGGLSASLTYATFSLLGTLFGITTPLQLMELAHPDQPVLRRLMREAPGTYHHSLVVSNLAERAAEMVDADALLTRVCAYYHDIGKVERPYYFIDNQSGLRNVHDDLSPGASARIIADHVADGVRLGRKYKLPRRVLDAIPQHHGTMLIKYFYYKALEEDPNANPDDFRYPGPRPQTKENAILMLADGVEATVRAMAQSGALDKKPSIGEGDQTPAPYNDYASLPEDAIAQVVHRVISERIEDGQLDECDLTVRDIARIQEAFVSMLKGIYHPRILYPEAPKRADEANSAPTPQPSFTNGYTGPTPKAGNGTGAHNTSPLDELTSTREREHGEEHRAASLN